MTKIKICGVSRERDSEAVNAAMPEYVGFVFAESHRRVTPAQALALRKRLHPSIQAVGVFVNETIDTIRAIAESGIVDVIQLHGGEDEETVARVKEVTGKPVIKAVPVTAQGDVQAWQNSCADFLLLDGVRGGGGRAFDWTLIGEVSKPFFLAGGIHLGNVEAAITAVHPFAVDVSSGVETDKVKDPTKITAFVSAVKGRHDQP